MNGFGAEGCVGCYSIARRFWYFWRVVSLVLQTCTVKAWASKREAQEAEFSCINCSCRILLFLFSIWHSLSFRVHVYSCGMWYSCGIVVICGYHMLSCDYIYIYKYNYIYTYNHVKLETFGYVWIANCVLIIFTFVCRQDQKPGLETLIFFWSSGCVLLFIGAQYCKDGVVTA